MAPRIWTPDQRQKQREAIQLWKPWKQSSGPKSLEGKAAAARNAWTGGDWKNLQQAIKTLNGAMRKQRAWLA